MWGHYPRRLLLSALLLDSLGQLFILFGVVLFTGGLPSTVWTPQLDGQVLWIIFCLFLYPLLGWLFGSYTVLSWRRLAFPGVSRTK